MSYVSGKNTLLKRKKNKKEEREARQKERAETIAKSGPVKFVTADPKALCPLCEGPMKLNSPKPGQKWKAFWGCVNFKITGCKGSRKA